MHFTHPLVLVGLAAMAVPPLVHLLARRRYDEVEWGALRFLWLAPKVRRKLRLEPWLLAALRAGALGLLAVALAGPAVRGPVDVGTADAPARPAGNALVPITADRAFGPADATFRFGSGLRRSGPADAAIPVRLEIDGRPTGVVSLEWADSPGAIVPLRVGRRFLAGSHLVTLRHGADRRDFAVEVLPGPADPPAAANLTPGEPLVFHPRDDEPPGPVTVARPDGAAVVVPVRAWPAVYDATHDPGAYRLTTAAGRVRYYAVQADVQEAHSDESQSVRDPEPEPREFRGPVLAAALVLFAASVWYARRVSRSVRPG